MLRLLKSAKSSKFNLLWALLGTQNQLCSTISIYQYACGFVRLSGDGGKQVALPPNGKTYVQADIQSVLNRFERIIHYPFQTGKA